jgi:superfamily II DNA/RNA helicase
LVPAGLFDLLLRFGLLLPPFRQELENLPSTFAALGVPTRLCEQLARRGIDEPFPIQAATLPDALAGRDICGRAPTGSGKTIAFGLAVAARVGRAKPRHPRALVLVPTRELATQVAGEIDLLLGRGSDKKVAVVFGGTGYGAQRKALSRGAAILVACPGRLEDLIEQGDVRLDQVDLVVLDEADRMADMGFLPAVKRLLDQTNPKRQTLLFSATLDGEVDAVVRRYQRDPAHHDVTPDDADDQADVEHTFWRAERSQHVGLAAALVQEHGRALVFCRTRRGADRVAKQLKANGLSAVAIHGSRTQSQREKALAAFAAGKADALVATDVAARGIHVDHVACVVHYDLPEDPKDYVHRSGRTGRAGATGTVVSLVTGEQRRAVRTLQRKLGLPESLDAPTLDPPPKLTCRPQTAPDRRTERSSDRSPDRSAKPKPKSGKPRPSGSSGNAGNRQDRRRHLQPTSSSREDGRPGGNRRRRPGPNRSTSGRPTGNRSRARRSA